jgi:hypothetical protein
MLRVGVAVFDGHGAELNVGFYVGKTPKAGAIKR